MRLPSKPPVFAISQASQLSHAPDSADAALLCFRTACAARSWLLRGVAAGEVFAAEEALSAQLLYERRRAGVSKTRTRVVVVPAPSPTRASSRPRKQPRLPGFSVAWMGEFVDVPAKVPGRMRGFLPPAPLSTCLALPFLFPFLVPLLFRTTFRADSVFAAPRQSSSNRSSSRS